jgi:hypothetical protein
MGAQSFFFYAKWAFVMTNGLFICILRTIGVLLMYVYINITLPISGATNYIH